MNHPKPEDWAPYLYGEAKPDIDRQLRAHLGQCEECRRKFESLKRTSGRLDAWKLPRVRPAAEVLMPLFKWAATACMILLAGFAIGRISAKPDLSQLRAEMRQEYRQEMAKMIRTEVDKASVATLAAANDNADKVASAYVQTLYVALKKDVDTLALNADAGLRRTAQQLVQLASYQSNLPGAKETQQ